MMPSKRNKMQTALSKETAGDCGYKASRMVSLARSRFIPSVVVLVYCLCRTKRMHQGTRATEDPRSKQSASTSGDLSLLVVSSIHTLQAGNIKLTADSSRGATTQYESCINYLCQPGSWEDSRITHLYIIGPCAELDPQECRQLSRVDAAARK